MTDLCCELVFIFLPPFSCLHVFDRAGASEAGEDLRGRSRQNSPPGFLTAWGQENPGATTAVVVQRQGKEGRRDLSLYFRTFEGLAHRQGTGPLPESAAVHVAEAR